jgi:hypothetical protein
MTTTTIQRRHDYETAQLRSRCVTPSAYSRVMACVTQGALCGFAAARPWALGCNAVGVKTLPKSETETAYVTITNFLPNMVRIQHVRRLLLDLQA